MNNQNPGNQALEDAEVAPRRGGALVPQTPGVPTASVGSPVTPTQTDVIRGGIDGPALYHSLRRRWLLAICMGLLTGALAGAALFWFFEESASAVKTFYVQSKPPSVLDPIGAEASFDTFRSTQMQAVTGFNVLTKALRDPAVANSPVLKGVEKEKRVEWLRDELQVVFPDNAEYMQIRLTESAKPEELRQIVEAVSKAYLDEIVFADYTSRLKPRDILRASQRKLNEEIKRKSEDYYRLMEDAERQPAGSGVDPATTMMLSEIRELQKQKTEAQTSLMQETVAMETYRQQLGNESLREYRIQQAIDNDPMLAGMKQNAMYLEQAAGASQGVRKGRARAASGLSAQLAGVQQQIAQYEQRLRAEIESQLTDEPDPMLTQMETALRVKQQYYQQRMKQAQQDIDKLVEQLREKGKVDTDLEMRYAEIEQLQSVNKSIAERIEQWDVESEAPMRVREVEGIELNPKINTFQRYAITGLGGLLTFALTCFGIAYMEFRNRRLNGPEQVDEGLGIRVIGTLPSLSGRAKLDPRHPVVAQLTESIDSVRTALMHESTTKRRQLVLVTSAQAMEGRTTVASQLAASLARAGRRTLLVDGDLRRPALHSLFDVPLEDGLCEVLRAETDVADVIRPTHAEGLWLMTAGYCDADAVHALATDQAQPIFEKLRADYDFIIIDGAPVLGLSDSLLFGQHCDGAIMSVLRDFTNVPKIHQSAELLRSVGIRLIGCVVNGVPFKTDHRVTHLQVAGSKSARKQLENTEA